MTDDRPVAGPSRARPADRRSWQPPAIPAHVGVVLGLASAGYAVALAGVTGLQAATEGGIVAERAPVAAAIDEAAAKHDRLDAALAAAARDYAGVAGGYTSAVERLADVESRIETLASLAGAIDGATRALPTRIAMPPVVRSVATSARSGAHATSGGSAAP
jgi:hypothetical protein